MSESIVKAEDYQVVTQVPIEFDKTNGQWEDFTLDQGEYTYGTMAGRLDEGTPQLENRGADPWFNLEPGEEGSLDLSNYYSEGSDIVFYFIQAGKTDGVNWKFQVAPQGINIRKSSDNSAEENWASNERTIVYGGTTMRTIDLSEVLIEGFSTRSDIEGKVNSLMALLDPVQFKKHIAPMVFELVAKPEKGVSAESRSYGYYIITELNLEETLRTKTGKPLRVMAEMSLQEVPRYQIHDGRDLTLPDNLIVKVIKTEEEEDGKTDKDKKFEPKQTRTRTKYKDKNGKTQEGTKVTNTVRTDDGVTARVSHIEDAKGNKVSGPTVEKIDGPKDAVQKYGEKPALLDPYINKTNSPKKTVPSK